MSWRTIRAKGKLRPRGQMNKTEAAYADHLKMLERTGVIAWFAYEAIKFRLANNTFYTPDFLVMLSDGQLEVHEVKGRKGEGYYAEDDAKVKIKVAAALYPMLFRVVWPDRECWWKQETISSEAA